jgi:hypothetical protein
MEFSPRLRQCTTHERLWLPLLVGERMKTCLRTSAKNTVNQFYQKPGWISFRISRRLTRRRKSFEIVPRQVDLVCGHAIACQPQDRSNSFPPCVVCRMRWPILVGVCSAGCAQTQICPAVGSTAPIGCYQGLHKGSCDKT